MTSSSSLLFQLPCELGTLELAPQVLSHFDAHKQGKRLSREAGGQLFATFDTPALIRIVDVTGPRPTDRRSIYRYEPDRRAETAEISERYSRGLHFLGDWHTHFQRFPVPSSMDERSMREMVQRSSHSLSGFVMVVVGQAEFPDGIHVSFHSKTDSTRLSLL